MALLADSLEEMELDLAERGGCVINIITPRLRVLGPRLDVTLTYPRIASTRMWSASRHGLRGFLEGAGGNVLLS